MIANALRAEIELYAARARRHNPLFVHAEAGRLSIDTVRRYLVNLRHILLHTPLHISRAAERAHALGKLALAQHLEQKLQEEIGHDVWAQNDITALSAKLEALRVGEPLRSAAAIAGYVAAIIEEDPALYLAYALFAEQLTVELGPAWLKLLEERCGIPQSSMTVVAKHAELDHEHVEKALDEIDDLVSDPRQLPRMREVLLQSMANFDRFCEEVTQERASDVRSLRDSATHVSAA